MCRCSCSSLYSSLRCFFGARRAAEVRLRRHRQTAMAAGQTFPITVLWMRSPKRGRTLRATIGLAHSRSGTITPSTSRAIGPESSVTHPRASQFSAIPLSDLARQKLREQQQAQEHPDWTLRQFFAKVLGSLSGQDVNNDQGNSAAEADYVASQLGMPTQPTSRRI